ARARSFVAPTAFLLCICGIAALSIARAAAPSTTPPVAHVPPSWSGPAEKLVNPPISASLSADRLRAAWTSDDRRSLLSATRSGPSADWTEPDRLLSTRGTIGKLVFAPDGRRIAYEDQRTWRDNGTATDRWQFIGIYDLATQQVDYLDPAFDLDSDPRWSADGTQITFAQRRWPQRDRADTRRSRPGDR